MKSHTHLRAKLDLIHKKLPFEFISSYGTKEDIDRYYKRNLWAYRIFHNRFGYMHMGLSDDNTAKFKQSDLLTQLNHISMIIKEQNAKRVLELGSGQGANLKYLSKHFPDVEFLGIDLSHESKTLSSNAKTLQGDYHKLTSKVKGEFDVVFAIETLCHSNNKVKVLNEVAKLLTRSGYFISYDAYRIKTSNLSETEEEAIYLASKCMSVQSFDYIDTFEEIIAKSNLYLETDHDYSINILPSLRRFARLAQAFLSLPSPVINFLRRIFPKEFLQNIISGYLMIDLVEAGLATYRCHRLRHIPTKKFRSQLSAEI